MGIGGKRVRLSVTPRHNVRLGAVLLGLGTLPVAANGQISRDTAKTLDTVRVTAAREPEYLHDFYVRRRMGLGRFLTSAQLDSAKHETLADFVAQRFTGLHAEWDVTGTGVSLRSTRGFYSFRKSAICNATVFLDDMLATGGDLAFLAAGDVAGVEYYSNAPPVRYTRAGAHCGVFVVWRKR